MLLGTRRTALRRALIAVYTPRMHPTHYSAPPVQTGLMERRKALRLAAVLPWAMLVAGCGQRGPLYHPPEPDEEDEDGQTPPAGSSSRIRPEPDEEDEDGLTNAAPPAPGSRLA